MPDMPHINIYSSTCLINSIIHEHKLEVVASFCYLGDMLSAGGGCEIMVTTLVLFVCIVALRPKSTAKVMAGRSVHLTTLFTGQA